MTKRDFTQEILQKKSRKNGTRWQIETNLQELEQSFQELKQKNINNNQVLSLYVVGIVSCIESFVRDVICTFIDQDPKYLERVPELLKEEKRLDFNIVKGIHQKTITIGEFVSHLLTIKNMNDIENHLKILFENNLKYVLSNVKEFREIIDPSWFDEPVEESLLNDDTETEANNLVNDVESLMQDLRELFTLRHITAHEGIFQDISFGTLENFFKSSQIFIEALNEYTEQTLHPNIPRSGYGMSVYSQYKASTVIRSTELVYNELLEILSESHTLSLIYPYYSDEEKIQVVDQLKISQEAFLKYLEEAQTLHGYLLKGVSGQALSYYDAQIRQEFYKARQILLEATLTSVKKLIEFSEEYLNE